MNERRTPLTTEEPKYRKKSDAKGLPRSKHKHIYETVLLTKYYHGKDFKTGRPSITASTFPYKVCVICGRIGDIDKDTQYYVKKVVPHLPVRVYETELSDKALQLPRWYADDFWDKFAHEGE